MAIIDGIPGIEVTIWVNGRPAFEYADPDHHQVGQAAPKVSSKFIESRGGATFTIHIRVDRNYNHRQPSPHTLNLAAYIDGQWICGELCREAHLNNGIYRIDIKDRTTQGRDGTVAMQAFKFAEVATGKYQAPTHFSCFIPYTFMSLPPLPFFCDYPRPGKPSHSYS